MNEYKSDYTASYFRDKSAGVFYDKGISNKFELFLFELEKKILFALAQKVKNSLQDVFYLDFACGTGRIIALFKDTFKTLIGVDTSSAQLALAKEKVPKAKFIVGNIVSNPELIADKSVNLITSFRLFLNLEPNNRGVILAQFRRILTDNGFLIVDNHMNRYSVLGLIALFMRKVLKFQDKSNLQPGQKGIINTMSETEMRNLLQDNGFTILRVARIGLIPGYKSICLLPVKWLFPLEMFLAKIPVLNLISKNQIFFCQKKKD